MKRALAAACLSLICLPVWAQPSAAEREQERQAKQARERHPGSTPAGPSRPAAVKTNDKKSKAPRPKQGEAAVTTGR
jgi:hypothetical protein